MLNPRLTLNCKGRLLSLQTPQVMGILNVTPDSFYDGGRFRHLDQAVRQAAQMLNEGAAIIDVGGMSSRPGAELISPEEELKRVLPVVEAVSRAFPEAIISVDTIRSKVARAAVAAGAHMINDISAGAFDDALYATVAELGVPYILMHMKGSPKTMQEQPAYADVVQEVLDFLIAEIGKLRALGVKDIIVDPGFGFGKSVAHNYALLKRLHAFQVPEVPVLAGLSRKSMIYKVTGGDAQSALPGTAALNMAALQQGARLLRVHDVKAAVDVISLWKALEEA